MLKTVDDIGHSRHFLARSQEYEFTVIVLDRAHRLGSNPTDSPIVHSEHLAQVFLVPFQLELIVDDAERGEYSGIPGCRLIADQGANDRECVTGKTFKRR
jgi:hypothetical protein